jgi:biotin carboxylase
MTRPTVAIVDPFSTGAHLAGEFASRGWRAVAVLSRRELPELYADTLRREDFPEVIVHDGVAADTVAALRRFSVGAVVAGTEIGVEVADLLAEALGLEGNGTVLSRSRRDKAAMVEALRAAGVRRAKTWSARTAEEAVTFATEHGRWPVVLKPADSAGADGVTFCGSAEEVRQVFGKLYGAINRMGGANDRVIVQELLVGQQYFINTVSRAGRHVVGEIWVDRRRRVPGAGLICDREDLLPAHGNVQDRLRDYGSAVLDALGIVWGPAHTEVMLTTDGPVLIETAARMQGTIIPEAVVEATGASHVTLTVDCVTGGGQFERLASDGYPLRRHFSVVSLIADRDGSIRDPHAAAHLAALPSYYGLIGDLGVGMPVQRTVDLFTSPGIVYLLSDNADQIEADYQAIRGLEAAGLYR